MKLNMYCVYDSVAQAFIAPFSMLSDAVAKRVFAQCANDPSHQFHQHSADYTLFKVGEFDDSTGDVIPCNPMSNLGCAASYRVRCDDDVPAKLEVVK